MFSGRKIEVFLVATKIMNGTPKNGEMVEYGEGCLVRILLKEINKPSLFHVLMRG
jgi:hypothetical protein